MFEDSKPASPTPSTPGVQFFPAKAKANIYAKDHVYRTCAYCRVSTESDMQMTSYDLQVEHYRNLASEHPNWDLQKVYADRGISGTSLKNREQFNEMLAACWAGKYNLIVTKSVSRFARNLVDCISLVRKLKAHNPPIGVFFETDNLFTLSEDSELKLSLLATFAQEESTKKRESMIWSLIERFKRGQLLLPECYGYTRERDSTGKHYVKGSKLQIVEEEAAVVRFIYDAFLAGYPLESIADILTAAEIPNATGTTDWSVGGLRYMLSNERYCGNVLTWKTVTTDMFEHTHKRNDGDQDQYLYEQIHDPIIPVSKFEAVQVLLSNRKHGVKAFPRMHVIDDGIFRGYIPVNHHWMNNDPHTYYEATNTVRNPHRVQKIARREFSRFDLNGYQVVRGQFMMHRAECPAITINDKRISFNVECQRKFHDVNYIQLLIHPVERKIAIRPCLAMDVHSIRWRIDAGRPFIPKSIACQYFADALYQIMGWNPEYQYRIRGTWAARGKDQIIVFDITNAAPFTTIEQHPDEETTVRKRLDILPQNPAFGTEFYEYNIQNAFYYMNPRTDWNAQAKSHAIADSAAIDLLSESELSQSMELIKTRVGVNTDE